MRIPSLRGEKTKAQRVGPSLRSLHEERRLGMADLGVDDAENLGRERENCK